MTYLSRTPWVRLTGSTVCATAIAVMFAGCGGGEDDAPKRTARAPVAYEPAAPPPPKLTTVADLMRELGIDERVMMAEDQAPKGTDARRAVLEFFDALARGDHEAYGGMMTTLDQMQLEDMVESGVWQEATAGITEIEIQTGKNDLDQECALAVITVDDDFQAQLWYYIVNRDEREFEAAPTPPGIFDQLSGDWIQAWHILLKKEIELANKGDEEFDPIDRDSDAPATQGGSGSGSSGSSASPGGSRPGPGGSPGGTPRKKRPKRRPPGPPR